MLIAGGLIIFSLNSCKKENLAPVTSGGGLPIATPFTIDLVADHWVNVNYANEMYVNDFPGILSISNATGSRTVNVYLMADGKGTQINHSVITFMGNELWATTTPTDLRINYRCAAPKLPPFTSLNIKVVVQ